jgi:hypothetical protein
LAQIGQKISGTFHEGLSSFYIADSDICSSEIQKRTHCCVSMATFLIFIARFSAKVIQAKLLDGDVRY